MIDSNRKYMMNPLCNRAYGHGEFNHSRILVGRKTGITPLKSKLF